MVSPCPICDRQRQLVGVSGERMKHWLCRKCWIYRPSEIRNPNFRSKRRRRSAAVLFLRRLFGHTERVRDPLPGVPRLLPKPPNQFSGLFHSADDASVDVGPEIP